MSKLTFIKDYYPTWKVNALGSTDMANIRWLIAEAERLASENAKLRNLIAIGVTVVEDFMPNIGSCALQDYGRLNSFLVDSRKISLEEVT